MIILGVSGLFINYCTTIGGVCQTLTLMLDTSNSGYVYILTLMLDTSNSGYVYILTLTNKY